MKKLTNQTPLNNAEAYDQIFAERQKKGVDEHDMRRWKRLLKFYKGGPIIDIGCLDSPILGMALEKYPKHALKDESCSCNLDFHAVGIDPAKEAMEKRRYDHPDISYCVGDIYTLVDSAYKTYYGTFSYAVMGELLEHLERPEDAIKEAMRILKPGGVLAISVPLEEAKEPGACDKDRHLWSFSKQDMRELLEPYGKVEMEVIGSLFSIFPPFYRYCWPSLISFCWKL